MTLDRKTRAQVILEDMQRWGLSMDDLQAIAATGDLRIPTIAEFLPTVIDSHADGTAGCYNAGWNLLVEHHGDKRLDQVTAADLQVLAKLARKRAKKDQVRAIDGRSAEEHFISGARSLFDLAIKARYVTHNPALEVKKPPRRQNERRALTTQEIAEIWEAASYRSDDPELDLLLVRFHLETGARRGGALGLTLGALNKRLQTVRLYEKNDRRREIPVTLTLIEALDNHARSRGAESLDDSVFRYARAYGSPNAITGVLPANRPIGRKRYNTIFGRCQRQLGWAKEVRLGSHHLRHTAVTNVERVAGHAVAALFAGHSDIRDTTLGYTKATINEIADAQSIIWGEPHPLASEAWDGSGP